MMGRGVAQGREPAATSPAGGTMASDVRGHERIIDVILNARRPRWLVVEGYGETAKYRDGSLVRG